MPSFTRQQVPDPLREIMLDYGREHVYVSPTSGISCFYRQPKIADGEPATPGSQRVAYSDGAPGCIIGHLFDQLGALPAKLGMYSFDGWATAYAEEHELPVCEGQSVDGLLGALDISLDEDVEQALSIWQQSQDAGNPWRDGAHDYCRTLNLDYDEFMRDVTAEGRLAVAS
jgi:hypothetical protein